MKKLCILVLALVLAAPLVALGCASSGDPKIYSREDYKGTTKSVNEASQD